MPGDDLERGALPSATGLIDGRPRPAAMCKRLLDDDMYSGWGNPHAPRDNERRYNPDELSQRLGVGRTIAQSPAMGLARGGDHEGRHHGARGLFRASTHLQWQPACPTVLPFFVASQPRAGAVPRSVPSASMVLRPSVLFLNPAQAMPGIRVLGFVAARRFESQPEFPSVAGLAEYKGLKVWPRPRVVPCSRAALNGTAVR